MAERKRPQAEIEAASPRRLEKAREERQIAFPGVGTFMMLAAGVGVI